MSDEPSEINNKIKIDFKLIFTFDIIYHQMCHLQGTLPVVSDVKENFVLFPLLPIFEDSSGDFNLRDSSALEGLPLSLD